MREKMDLLREKSELSASDQAMIVELQFRVSSLTDEAGLLQRDKQGLVDTLKVRARAPFIILNTHPDMQT